MHRLLRCNINAGVHAHVRNGRVTQRCRNSPDGTRGNRVRMTSRTGSSRRILEIWRKLELSSASREDGWFFACAPRPWAGVARDGGGGRWKSKNRKNVYLSPYVETFNSKVMKGFVPELRCRKCFSCFEIPMFYVYMLWTFYVRFAYPYRGYGTFRRKSIWEYR